MRTPARSAQEGPMHQRFSAITVFVLTVIPAVVSAQEHDTALSPFAGDVGNALWTVVIFVLVVLVLGKFAWGPILNQLKTREKFIHDALSSAKQQREAAEATLKEYGEKLRAARAEADAIIAQSRTDAAGRGDGTSRSVARPPICQ